MNERCCASCQHWKGERSEILSIGKCTNDLALYRKIWDNSTPVMLKDAVVKRPDYTYRSFCCDKGYLKDETIFFSNGVFKDKKLCT